MRKTLIALMLILTLLGITSCYDAHEIDDLLHVIAIGVDKGATDKWRLTLQFARMNETGGGGSPESSGGGGSQGGNALVTIDAPSFFAGLDMLNASLPRQLCLFHAQILVFSEELAKTGLIGEYIAPIIRYAEIRRSSFVMVCKGEAADFLKENKPVVGATVSKDFQVLMQETVHSGFFPSVTLEQFSDAFRSTYRQSFATLAAVNDFSAFQKEGEFDSAEFREAGDFVAGEMPRKGENKIELFGTALFDGDKMVGELTGNETRYMLMAQGRFERAFFTMQDPQRPELIIPLDVTGASKPKVRITFEGGKPIIRLKVWLNADLLSVQSRINYEKSELQKIVEKEFAGIVEKGIVEVVQKCQDLNADVFEFGHNATRNFGTIDELERYNWNGHFKDAQITVEVEFAIRRTGTMIKSTPHYNSEGVQE